MMGLAFGSMGALPQEAEIRLVIRARKKRVFIKGDEVFEGLKNGQVEFEIGKVGVVWANGIACKVACGEVRIAKDSL